MNVLTHAGAVAIRRDQDEWRYLLVKASPPGAEWVLPKGHIERGESAQEAALRELAEEAGVAGDIRASLGTWTFHAGGNTVVVEYFLIDAGTHTKGAERQVVWLPFVDAVAATPFPETKSVIRAAALVV